MVINNFNSQFIELCKTLLYKPNCKIYNRKKEVLHEFLGRTIVLNDLDNCYAFCRDLNFYYLIGELIFYMKGENKLKNINEYSKFWNKCSDDNENLNSCYGYYIWKMDIPDKESKNQFEYCYNQLVKNKETKKAVITIYDSNKHSKKTNDNPCTMFLQFFIRENVLYLNTFMRSNDLWYGLSYDLPFFVFVLKQMFFKLRHIYPDLRNGVYFHNSNSLHIYEKNFTDIEECINNPKSEIEIPKIKESTFNNFNKLIDFEESLKTNKNAHLNNNNFKFLNIDMKDDFLNYCKKVLTNFYFFNLLKDYAALNSTCLKKKVACLFFKDKILSMGYSGRPFRMGVCTDCKRTNPHEEFFTDQCNSLHSEQRAILHYLNRKNKTIKDFEGSVCYLTHAPCDQCMKFLIEIGCKKIIYRYSYKTHFKRYKDLIEIEDGYGRKII